MTLDTQGIEQAAAQTTRENQLRYVFNVTARRWRLILLFTMAGVLGLPTADYLTNKRDISPVWQAETQLIVRESPYDMEIFKGLGGAPLFRNAPDALIARIHKRDVAEDIARGLVQEGLFENDVTAQVATEDEYAAQADTLEQELTFETVKNTNLITIRGKGPTPEQARRIVDLAARAFIRRNQQYLVRESQQAYRFLTEQIEETSKLLDDAESAEWQFRKEMGFRTFERYEEDMKTLQEEITRSEATREEIRAKIAEVEEEVRKNSEKLPEALSQINDTVVNRLMDELNALLQEQISLSVVWQPGEGPLRELQDEIEEKRQAIIDAVTQLDQGIEAGASLWDKRKELRTQYTQLQLDLTSLDIRTATMEKLLNNMIEQWPELSARRKEYQGILRKAENLRNQFNRLMEKKAELEEAMRREAGPLERHTPVSAAVYVGETQRLRIWFDFLIGGVIGFALGFALALSLELMDTSIRTVEDVTQFIGLEVIGTIPKMHFGKTKPKWRSSRRNFVPLREGSEIDACIVTLHDPKSPISESYRTLRTNFQFATLQTKPHSLMVTSAVPGEGKTTTAVNMAVTFADSGFKVLILDTDLRRPHVHHVLHIERGPGLAEALSRNADIQSLIQPTQVKNLWAVCSGQVPPNPSELIGSERMHKIMKQLGKQFDLVICDAPSILVVTDPMLLATTVDTVVLVVSANNARRETVLRARKLMETAHASIAGVVLNGLEATRRHYYYYYYYYEDSSYRRRRWIHI
ncbi:MAG TPA: polysaccharide biosynthesis tyrosine autokinase [Candidatus Hydrogenedentes bacterium]|nr:polysaccharide biosynthesis tyrosine autokinase [Candidatus Hydrogenedentota bacterium]HOL77765.1 polysaccharide biosynthesis tyrosine autokinase [Candidatus Hydrogenedentota bacterium]HPO86421.1 polysaccharide biosynthesis tyrosine autokinase [Candidatus Hydrogenedentota bacterium]